MSASEFLKKTVLPTVDRWKAEPENLTLAKQAANELNNLAEHAFHDFGKGSAPVYGSMTPGQFRTELAARECPDFALIRDIAEAHKHVQLDRPNRSLTTDSQTLVSVSGGWGDSAWGEEPWGGETARVVVHLDDGTKRVFWDLVKSVLSMWQRLFP